MKTIPLRARRELDILISYAVFAFLLVFTYGVLFLVPYPGFYFNPTNGAVTVIFEDLTPATGPRLMIGDVIKRVGQVTFETYSNSATVHFFDGYQPGEVAEIVVERNGESLTIPWVYAGFNNAEFASHLFNVWWLAYIFWLVGTATQLFMRPKDRRWGLFVASNYLTGMFIMVGTLSSFQFLASSILLRVIAWLMMPVYLHFHWIFPRSLRRIPRWAKYAVYLFCGAMAGSQFFSATPGPSYFFAVILAFGGSILLLTVHYILQPEYRRDVGILAVAAFFSLGFMVVASVVGSVRHIPRSAVLSILTLPILPGAYFYVLFRRSIGGLELRANRALSIYFYFILFGIILLLTFGFLDLNPETAEFAAVMIALAAALLGILFFPAFQSWVERRLLGIQLPAQNIVEKYSAHIVTSASLLDLTRVLTDEILPSLLTRQFAFFYFDQNRLKLIALVGVSGEQLPGEQDIASWQARFGVNRPMDDSETPQPYDWIRLILPLKLGDRTIGFWLLGRRDPDDWYAQAEISILQSLANQTAVALSNIQQTERVREMYEANVQRHEQERQRLARELHDSVLNELATLATSDDAPDLSPRMQAIYDAVTHRLREIVGDLRPPMLNFGLRLAFEGLADNLTDRSQDSVQIVAQIQADGDFRYHETVEINLFRIVQEACQNALRYAHAKSIRVNGTLTPDTIEIAVTDDGIGFVTETSLKLDEMLANKHFGLANMLERANLIGAEINIDSNPGRGTQVRVKWKAVQEKIM